MTRVKIEYTGRLSTLRIAWRATAAQVTLLAGSNTAIVHLHLGKTVADLQRNVPGCTWYDVTPAYFNA